LPNAFNLQPSPLYRGLVLELMLASVYRPELIPVSSVNECYIFVGRSIFMWRQIHEIKA